MKRELRTRCYTGTRGIALRRLVGSCVLAFVFGSGASASQAQRSPLGFQLARAAHDVTAAFQRRSAVFVQGTYDQLNAPAGAADLYPTYPFAPSTSRVQWTIAALDTDRSTVCFTVQPRNLTDWQSVVQGISRAGLTPATTGCAQTTGLSVPAGFPVAINANMVLDRRSVALPTAAVSGLSLSLSTDGTVTAIEPGPTSVAAILQAHAGQTSTPVTVQVTNNTAFDTLALVNITTTPGFTSGANDCAALALGQTCSVSLAFNPAQVGGSSAGRLRMTFAHHLTDGTVDALPELTVTFFGEQLP